MNIQQLRYVVAIARSGTFREAASSLFVSQPSLSVSIKDLEEELGFKIFTRTATGAVLTKRGRLFMEKAQKLVTNFESFENQYSQLIGRDRDFSLASQHYDFLPDLILQFAKAYPEYNQFRIFESTTIQILDEVVEGYSELGLIYLNEQNRPSLLAKMEQEGLEYIELATFQTHIYLRQAHPLAEKSLLTIDDLANLPTVRFTQEKDEYLYYFEHLVDRRSSSAIFNVTDRATLTGILEQTDAYATGSGFVPPSSGQIIALPLADDSVNHLVYVKRSEMALSPCADKFVETMKTYFEQAGKGRKA
ncbi:LysR family transcriptional regulator [Streptococcus cuniculipharyngis]|uniref:LysR family transcriptional regulator n=1 Tax=Streptococcus cuniculipharyngis TaxID=1562651 RepID=A0A5C5SGU5_9STRE|nr:LysR family transcriptional regulator [Streptococcus cuniculipharyngis]TWS99131.1 LysR family transcriptional regulator [Streptococcus cuniculipharyngis]